jgi:NADPH2:quinone reductase
MKALRVHEFGEPEVLGLEEVPMRQSGLGQLLVRMHAIGGPKFCEMRISWKARIMRIPIIIGITALSLIALGQTEPQHTTQGQTKETRATAPAKETKMHPAQEQSMKAIRVHEFGGPEVLRLEEVPTPRPGPGQVLVRMHAIGVNPVETYIRTGTYAYKPTLPYTPGNDGAGVVEEIGPDVNELKPGDRVYTARSVSGTYAEFALCTTEQVHPLPANVSFEQGAAMGTPYATAYRGLFQRADAKPGETVLVHGASGGVGTAAVQLARARGLRVFGTAGSDEGRKLAREQGAHEVFDHRAPDHFEQIMKATDGRGVDVIVELLANVNLGKDLTILAKGGRVAVIGSRGRVEIDPRDAMQRDADIRGMVMPNTPPAELASIHAALVTGLENGTLHPVIGKEFPLAEAAQAHRAVMEPGAFGKIVLRTGSEK